MADRTRIHTTHCLAECRNCGTVWDDYKNAADIARKHADKTGHHVSVERVQSWHYNRPGK
jgi:uncharacterized Zn finger protein